jgi:fermentation-respiration switch protein FrsA (DUF1100 family)
MSIRLVASNIAAVTLIGVFGFFLAGALFCSVSLHVPRRVGPAPPGAQSVSISARDRATLAAWWLRAAVPNGNCVAILHGIGDSRAGSAGYAAMFLYAGYSVLLPDGRAHGASGGALVTYGLLEKYDVLRWADWMKAAGCHRLYALGESLGASILIQSAAVQPAFSAIVAESPFADLREIAAWRLNHLMHVPEFVAQLVVTSAVLYAHWFDHLALDQVSPLRDIAVAHTPILLIHGRGDDRTPYYNSALLAKANPRDPLWLVPKAAHTGAASAEPDEFRRRVLDWFAEH